MQKKGIHTPTSGYLGLSYACNMNCQHCYAKNESRNIFLTFDEVKSVIDELEKMFTCNIFLGHGEPLLYPKIFDVLEYIKSKQLNSIIMTNGSLINRRTATRLSEIKPLHICISLDSATKEIHDRIRRSNGAWTKAFNALLLLKEKGLKVKIASTIDILDPYRSFNLIELTKRYNLDGINFLTIRSKNINFTKETIAKYIEALSQLTSIMEKDGDFKIRIHDPLILKHMNLNALEKDFRDNFIDLNRCTAGVSRISILPDGRITPCNLAELSLGNIRTDKISTVWQTSKLLQQIRNRNCSACHSSEYCQGGCLAFGNYNGKIFNRDIRCNQ